mgnify:CR=1 FL=1
MIERLDKILKNCVLCPHKCRVNRKIGQTGFCKAKDIPVVSSVMAHHGEEPPISGTKGSGTIFFSYCNMSCIYCQNYQISQEHFGSLFSINKLSKSMLSLASQGCHNINLVSPTIWIPQIVKAYFDAKKHGLSIPLVYNTGGYERARIIKMLNGIINIYMPDIRYSSNIMAKKYSGIENYVENSRKSILEMYRQVGGLEFDRNGTAKKGLLIRLLVLPGDISGVKQTLDFIKYELSNDIYLSIMSQYYPEYKACNYPELNRRINSKEYFKIVSYAEKLGLVNGWTQEHILTEEDLFMPDFKKKKVFKYYED